MGALAPFIALEGFCQCQCSCRCKLCDLTTLSVCLRVFECARINVLLTASALMGHSLDIAQPFPRSECVCPFIRA